MSLCVTLGEFHFRQKSNESDENLWRVPRWENSCDFLKQTAQPLVSSVGSSLKSVKMQVSIQLLCSKLLK